MPAAGPAEDFARGLSTVLESIAGVQEVNSDSEDGDYAEFDGNEIPRMDLDDENARVYDNPLRVWIPMKDGGIIVLQVRYEPPSRT